MGRGPKLKSIEQAAKLFLNIILRITRNNRFSSSAIILSDTQLLTNRHVWVHEDEWWNSELQEEQLVGFFYTCNKCDKLHLNTATFEIVAAGEIDTNKETTAEELRIEKALSDWALIETNKPFWDSLIPAPIHPPAIDPEWRVSDGTDLYVVGFSSIFKNESTQSNFVQGGPYTIAAKSVLVKDTPAISYNEQWPAPLGHSGGGV